MTGPFYTTPTVGLSSSANSTENCHFSLFGPSVPKPSLHIAAPATGVLFGGENSDENGPRFPGLEQTRCNTSGTKWVRRVLEFFWKVRTPSSTGPLGRCATFGGWKKAGWCPFYSPPLADYTYRISVAVRVVGVEVWSVGRHLSHRCWSEGVDVVKGRSHYGSTVGQKHVSTILFSKESMHQCSIMREPVIDGRGCLVVIWWARL